MFKWCHITKWLYNKFFCKFYAMQKMGCLISPNETPALLQHWTFKSTYNVLENGNVSEDTG